jgi:hypothetical protein
VPEPTTLPRAPNIYIYIYRPILLFNMRNDSEHSSLNIICLLIQHTNSSIFWYITPHISLKVNRRFGETCRLHLHFIRISQAREHLETGSNESSCWFLALHILRRPHVSLKRRLTFNRLHGAKPSKVRTLGNYTCENLKSYIQYIVSIPRLTIHSFA